MKSPTSVSDVAISTTSLMSGRLRSTANVRTSTPKIRRISSAFDSKRSLLRAIRRRERPLRAASSANAPPIPSEPPAITAHGPYCSKNSIAAVQSVDVSYPKVVRQTVAAGTEALPRPPCVV